MTGLGIYGVIRSACGAMLPNAPLLLASAPVVRALSWMSEERPAIVIGLIYYLAVIVAAFLPPGTVVRGLWAMWLYIREAAEAESSFQTRIDRR